MDRSLRCRPLLPLCLLLLALLAGCDDYPRDPEGTLDRVRGGVLRAGLVEQRPWAARDGERLEGVEVALVEALAASLGAEVRWSRDSGTAAFAALQAGELDLLIGGVTESDPWASEVAATRPYLVYDLVIAAPAGAPPGTLPTTKPRWQLGEDEVVLQRLEERRQVFLLPQGENAWLIAVDRFLRERGPQAWQALRQAAAQP